MIAQPASNKDPKPFDLKVGMVLGGVVMTARYSNNTRWYERMLLSIRRWYQDGAQDHSVPGLWGTDHLCHEQEGQADSL